MWQCENVNKDWTRFGKITFLTVPNTLTSLTKKTTKNTIRLPIVDSESRKPVEVVEELSTGQLQVISQPKFLSTGHLQVNSQHRFLSTGQLQVNSQHKFLDTGQLQVNSQPKFFKYWSTTGKLSTQVPIITVIFTRLGYNVSQILSNSQCNMLMFLFSDMDEITCARFLGGWRRLWWQLVWKDLVCHWEQTLGNN